MGIGLEIIECLQVILINFDVETDGNLLLIMHLYKSHQPQ